MAYRELFPSSLLRLVALASAIILVLFTASNILHKPQSYITPPSFFSSDRLSFPLPAQSSPVDSGSRRPIYKAPKDLLLPHTPPNSIPSESNVGKLTMLFNNKDPTYIRAIQSHEAHNRRYGYPLLVLRHSLVDGIWNKPAYILAALLEEMRKPEGERLEWLCWVDGDTVIMNPNIPLDIFLPPPPFSHIHLLLTEDPRGINNGVFLIKVNSWSIDLIAAVLAFPTFRPDVELVYRDQSAMIEVLKEKRFQKNHLLVPQRWFNAYQAEQEDEEKTWNFQVRHGDLLVHFAGVGNRDERMRWHLDMAEKHLPEYELELASTSYPTEIKEYWAEQHEKVERQRADAQRVVGEAGSLLKMVQTRLGTYGEKISAEEKEKVEKAVKEMRKTLDEERDDPDAIKHEMKILQETASPLEIVVQFAKQFLLKEAHTVIIKAERQLLQTENSEHPELMQAVQSKLEKLRELVARDPDKTEELRKAVDELNHASQDLKRKVDGD